MIIFKELQTSHFSLLLKWLNAPHVKQWWDKDIIWTIDLIKEKYSLYVQGFWIPDTSKKPLYPFIIEYENKPIGYIQLYNPFDTKDEFPLSEFPLDILGLDFFIGEIDFIHKGLGQKILKKFLETIAFKKADYILSDPEYKNEQSVRCFERSGFQIIKRFNEKFLMIKNQQKFRLPLKESIALEICFQKYFNSPSDHLWIFGSRVNLNKKGGDIDLYIETNLDHDSMIKANSLFLNKLQKKIGEQKIDVILNNHKGEKLDIYLEAKTKGVQII